MSRVLIGINLLLLTASTYLFVATLALPDQVTDVAKDYAAAETKPVADRLAAAAEAGLNSAAGWRLPARVREAVRGELDAYAADPVAAIRRWAREAADAPPPAARVPGLDAVFGWRDQVKRHFDRTFAALLVDLRIFAGTNVAAAGLAAWLTYRARGRHRWRLVGLSVFILAAVGWAGWVYADGMTVFRILRGTYMGWWYPALVAAMVFDLWRRFGRLIPPAPVPADRPPVGAAVPPPAG